jgi:membrane-associated phospholipid phosphatase
MRARCIRRRHAGVARISLSVSLLAMGARAEGALDERHPDGYYLARGSAAVAAVGVSISIATLFPPARPEPAPSEWLGWDDALRGRLSTSASAASDVSLLLAIALPLGAEMAHGLDTQLVNTSLFYGEVLGANLLLNTVVKYAVPRLRPYNHRIPAPAAYVASQGADAYLSFYSGHTSTAFAAAVGGSYLFAAARPDSAVTPWLWGTQTALATATAIWRVRSGKHFYSDVAVGFVAGTGIGLGIPLLEGVRYRPSATEMAFAGGGVAVGGLFAVLAPLAEEAAAALGATGVQIVPAFTDKRAGVIAIGQF